ncbi:hypothetical protein POKO110462_00455 [Pontibacter korlensis]
MVRCFYAPEETLFPTTLTPAFPKNAEEEL